MAHRRSQRMSAWVSAIAEMSGTVASGTNSSLLTRCCHSAMRFCCDCTAAFSRNGAVQSGVRVHPGCSVPEHVSLPAQLPTKLVGDCADAERPIKSPAEAGLGLLLEGS